MINGSSMRGLLCVVGTIVGLILSGTGGVIANSRRMPTLKEAFDEADIVTLVRIDGKESLYEQNSNCGIRYAGTSLRTFKGRHHLPEQKIIFGRYAGLDPDKTYLLFLHYDSDPETVYNRYREDNNITDSETAEQKRNVIGRIKCDGLVPGFIFNFRTAWEVQLNYVTIIGLLPEGLPENIRIYSLHTAVWQLQKHDLFSYLQSLSQR